MVTEQSLRFEINLTSSDPKFFWELETKDLMKPLVVANLNSEYELINELIYMSKLEKEFSSWFYKYDF